MPWKVKEEEPKLIQQLGVTCEKAEIDLSREDAPTLLLNAVQQTLGDPLVLVNNATYSTPTGVNDLTAEEMDKHYTVNVRGTTLLTLEFVLRFTHKNHGRIQYKLRAISRAYAQ